MSYKFKGSLFRKKYALDGPEAEGLQVVANQPMKAKTIDEVPNEVEVMVEGRIEFQDRIVQKWELEKIVDNFNKKVVPTEIPLHYDHPLPDYNGLPTKAAAWVEKLIIDESQPAVLKAIVNWTPTGKESVFKREYLYISAEIFWDYPDPYDFDKSHGPTLTAITLTNTPAVMKLNPIVSPESFARHNAKTRHNKKETYMTEEEVKKMNEEMEKLKEENKALKAKLSAFEQNKSEYPGDHEKMAIDLKLLRSENDSLKASLETLKAEKEKEKEKYSRERELEGLVHEKRITPAQKEKAMKLSSEQYEGFKLSFPAEAVYSNAPINKSEGQKTEGHAGGAGESKGELTASEAEMELLEIATKYEREKKMRFAEAYSLALSENPKWAAQTRN